MFGANPHHPEAIAKTATPATKTRRRPNKSPTEPPTKMSAPRNKPYDSTTHCASITVAFRLDWRAGSATFTTVLSMKAMLVPRIAAVRIQAPVAGLQGTVAGRERIAASSQGGFMNFYDDQASGEGAQDCRPWQNRLAGQ